MVDNNTVKGRLYLFLDYLDMGQCAFETACGLSNGYVNNIRRSITPEKLQKITRRFPALNVGWLMTGEGEMIRKSVATVENISGDGNSVFNQAVGDNCGQNAGRDINNYGEKEFMAEIISQRQHASRQLEVYAASLEKKDDQIDRLIQQNKEQFDRLTSLLEAMQRK